MASVVVLRNYGKVFITGVLGRGISALESKNIAEGRFGI
jgi:hypothetical protein